MKKIIEKILLIILIVIGLVALGILDIVGVIEYGMGYFFY
tara:strand:- start:684 stop:803 length:120 start_codon:yes stop_codon:yes gene_type:complete